jgi:transcriptional regulator with XRE-family HTH domain
MTADGMRAMPTDILTRETAIAADEVSANRSVGQKLRQLRKARGRSLKELSDEACISTSFVSQIERGLSSPSVRTLVRLADVLGVSMGELFNGLDQELDGEARIVARAFEQQTLDMPTTHVTKRWLTPFSKVPRLDIYAIDLAVNGTSGDHSYAHEGEEAGLVLEGGLELVVDRQRYVLGEGDSFRFASHRPHRFANAGNRPCKVLWVNYRETGSSVVTRFMDDGKEPG